jgi:RNA polymerase sigma-70 factor (ECF subfamily)
VSDVFISIWLNREKLATVDNIENYLFIITRNKSLNQQEKETSANVWTTETESENRIENSNPESLLISKELETAITSSIDQLPERCRIIFQMARYQKLKHKQIAEMLSISENTVHAQMMIAINKLHELLKRFIYFF